MTHPHRSGKAPSQRQLRVGEEIRHALAQIFERADVREPVLTTPPISVTEVRISPDLKNATAFVLRLGGGEMTDVLDALKRAKPYLRHRIAQMVRTRFVPQLSFEIDDSFDEACHIEALLHSPEVTRDLTSKTEAGNDEDDAP